MLKMLIRRTVIAVSLMFFAGYAAAEEMPAGDKDDAPPPSTFHWVLGGAGEFGGDRVVKVFFDDDSSESLRAGEGFSLAFGGRYQSTTAPFGVRGMLGFKMGWVSAKNADVTMSRFVLDVLPFYRINDDFWAGAGPVYHFNVEVDLDKLGPKVDFDNALGLGLEIGWRWFSVVYTHMRYKDEFGERYNGDAFGLRFGWAIGERFGPSAR